MNRTLLIVDRDAHNAELWRLIAELWGHDARVVRDFVRGVDAAKEWQPDCAQLDLGTPYDQGFFYGRLMRQAAAAMHCLIGLTSVPEWHPWEEAREYGFTKIVLKPCDPADLMTHLGLLDLRRA